MGGHVESKYGRFCLALFDGKRLTTKLQLMLSVYTPTPRTTLKCYLNSFVFLSMTEASNLQYKIESGEKHVYLFL